VGDNFFSPRQVAIARNGTVRWRWQRSSFAPHNVTLTRRHPREVNRSRFRSPTRTGGRFQRTFTVPGTYRFVCTIHPTTMRMSVRVGP
jgi:plastocyanin